MLLAPSSVLSQTWQQHHVVAWSGIRPTWARPRAPAVLAAASDQQAVTTSAPPLAQAKVQLDTGLHAGLSQAAQLLAEAFEDEDSSLAPSEQLLYQLRLTAVLGWQALTLRQQFAMLSVPSEEGQRPESFVGVANLTPNRGPQAIPGPLPEQLRPLRLAVVSNMAVAAAVRRRGLGRALLMACERAAAGEGYGAVALLVHQYNEAALRLYRSSGYQEASAWEDPAWLEMAQRGRVGPQRRLLMVKPLS